MLEKALIEFEKRRHSLMSIFNSRKKTQIDVEDDNIIEQTHRSNLNINASNVGAYLRLIIKMMIIEEALEYPDGTLVKNVDMCKRDWEREIEVMRVVNYIPSVEFLIQNAMMFVADESFGLYGKKRIHLIKKLFCDMGARKYAKKSSRRAKSVF